MSLCAFCDSFDVGNLVDDDGDLEDVPHHKSLNHLRASASSCRLCRLFWDGIASNLIEHGISLDDADEKMPQSNSPVQIRGRCLGMSDYSTGPIFKFKVRCDRLGPHAHALFSLYPGDEDADEEAISLGVIIGKAIKNPWEHLDLLKQWIEDCRIQHDTCTVKNAPLPSRVIDVGSDTREPHLQETSGEILPYIALSHCWGLEPVIVTVKANIDDHKKEVPFSSLSKTFQDAVTVSRALGIQYLWIDSLCIIQDSREDWEKESIKMGSIYSSSYLTIAASASSDSRGGCYIPRNSSTHVKVRCSLPTTSGTKPSAHVFVRPVPRGFGTLRTSPLHIRAWVTQERLLSPRIIHFDRDQMLWECREARWAEDGVPPTEDQVQTLLWDERLQLSYPYHGSGAAANGEFVWDWYAMVEAYSARGLTKAFDKLPAISGLAKVMEERTGDSYVAGLWRSHLAVGLAWHKSGKWLMRPDGGYRAPSWSWASLDGTIAFPDYSDIHGGLVEYMGAAVTNVEARAEPMGLDPRGMLAGGVLTLTGRLKEVDARPNPESASYKTFSLQISDLIIDYLYHKGEMIGVAYYDEKFKPVQSCVFCLELMVREMEPTRWYGLLLEATENQGKFRRVGFARTQGRPLTGWFADAPRMSIHIV